MGIEASTFSYTHKPYKRRKVDDVMRINVGSVGKPKDDDNRACYVTLKVREDISVEFRRIGYSIEAVAKAIKEGLPLAFAEMLRRGA